MSIFNVQIENPGTQELRKFGLVTGAIVAVLFGLLLPWLFDYPWPLWPWIVAGILWIWGLAHADSLFTVYRTWLKFGHVAGWINTRIILGIMFYIVFFPAGVLMRLVAKDPMARKLDDKANSYRIVSETMDKNHFERPY
jgi:uncharacterized membrane protein